MESCQQEPDTRGRCGSGRCGWSSNTATNTQPSGQRWDRFASKLGMTPETLRKWLRRDQVDSGRRPGVTTSERERIRQLEREVRELRRANEILKAASIFFAGELDPRRPKL
jgi:transposase